MKLPDRWYYQVERVNELLANRTVTSLVAAAVIAIGIAIIMAGRHHPLPRGVETLPAPTQTASERRPWRYADHNLTAVAEFEVEALVVHERRYRWGRFARVSPIDLGLAWGVATRDDVLDALEFDQYRRFLFYSWDGGALSVPIADLEHAVTNLHAIPADHAVMRALSDVNAGDIVRVRGVLVDVTGDDGWVVPTSRTRADRGAGACEVMWVESVTVR